MLFRNQKSYILHALPAFKANKGFLVLVAILLPVFLQAQIYSRSVLWDSPVVVTAGDSVYQNLSFDEAVYTNVGSLPVWSETFYDGNISENVTIDNCVFIPVSANEFRIIQQSGTAIPSVLSYSAHTVMSRKQSGIRVEIFPLVMDTLTRTVVKLSAFRIRFGEMQKAYKRQPAVYASHSVLAEGNWYKLAVTKTGIYQLGYNDLQAMGINMALLNPMKIGVFGRGGKMLPEPNAAFRPDDLPECAIEVTGQDDGKFDVGDQIVFYAQGPVTWLYNSSRAMWEHSTHLYTDTICYFLTPDQGTGKRIPTDMLVNNPETDRVTSFDYFETFDENNLNLIKSGRQWFAQSFEIILNKIYDFSLPALASGGEVKVRSVLAAKSLSRSSFGFTAGSETWSASLLPVTGYADSPVATGATVYRTLTGVTLPLKIDVRYNKTSSGGIGYLDLIDINARCDLRFTGGQLDFRDSRSAGPGRNARFSIADAAGKAKIWDVTNPANVTLVPTSAEGNALVFKKPSDSIRQFIAFDDSHLLKPKFVSKIPKQDLHASVGADMIILAPQVFMQQAQRLASFHSSASDLSVLVLDPVSIYNEFSSGNTDITAIRDFLRMLYQKQDQVTMPRYLLLFGDASYDYKNKIPDNSNFVPAWQSPESYNPVSSLVSDDYYGMLDDNEGQSYYDVIDIGIGRLPVRTAAEAEQAVDKIIHYSTPSPEISGDWQNVITFVADDEDLNDHIAQAEQMASGIEANNPDVNLDKIYLDSYMQVATPQGNRYPEVNKAITQRIEKGSLILNYTGHGGETGWAHEEVLTVNDITNWSNYNYLPVFVTATCEFSRYDDPVRQSAGEYVFTNPKGGGIALFTTTRPTYGTPNFELNKKFYQYSLSKPGGQRLRLGDIIMNSKRDKGSNENGRKYVLLGDPALKISFPTLNVVTQAINGHSPSVAADTLKAYMEVVIDGYIADPQGNLLADFNGTIYPSVFDKPAVLKTLSNDKGTAYTFSIRKNLLYKGKVEVKNGRFSFTFIVPKDIAYNYGFGKVSYFATDGTRNAEGSSFNMVIGGSAVPDVADNSGPEISLYMNSTDFRDGGITDQNARLLAVVSDENGINTIGNGIGHDITAVLDGNTTEPYILNEYYESDINTFKSGYIWFPFSMLSPGEHSLSVKVWDVFNNSSEAVIRFVVHSSGVMVISRSYNYPNPFSDYTDIVFEHNQQYAEFKTTAEIYSLSGRLVNVIEQTSQQDGFVSVPIRWNGLDAQGNKVPSGLYVYHLTIRTSNGQFAQTTGKMMFQK